MKQSFTMLNKYIAPSNLCYIYLNNGEAANDYALKSSLERHFMITSTYQLANLLCNNQIPDNVSTPIGLVTNKQTRLATSSVNLKASGH